MQQLQVDIFEIARYASASRMGGRGGYLDLHNGEVIKVAGGAISAALDDSSLENLSDSEYDYLPAAARITEKPKRYVKIPHMPYSLACEYPLLREEIRYWLNSMHIEPIDTGSLGAFASVEEYEEKERSYPTELLNDEVLEVHAEELLHDEIVNRIAERLREATYSDVYKVQVQTPLSVGKYSQLLPDLSVVPTDTDDSVFAKLVIEVADASLEKDRRLKKHIYANGAIPEYVIIAIPYKAVEVFDNPVSGVYQRRRIYAPNNLLVTLEEFDCNISFDGLL